MNDVDYNERLKTGRNEPCPCGSGKKYKKCHRNEDEGKRSAELKLLAEEAKARAAEKAEEEEASKLDGDTKGPRKAKMARGKSAAQSKGNPSGAQARNMPRRSKV